MDIKNWKQSPKIQEAKEKLEDEKVRGFMRWVFEIVVTLVLAAMVGILLFDDAGKFDGTDDRGRRPLFYKPCGI